MARVSVEDLDQFGNDADIKLHYNSSDELIWISYEYGGCEFRQQVSDDDYTGGLTWADIDRTVTFGAWVKQ